MCKYGQKGKMPVSECARQSPSGSAAMPRPVVAVNFAFWADCFRNPPVFAVTAPLPKKFSDTFWEPCLCAFPYLIRYRLRDVAWLGARARQRAGDGAASAAPSALPPTCIKDKHTSRSHTRIFTVYQPHIWRKRLFQSENLAVYCYSEVSFRDTV